MLFLIGLLNRFILQWFFIRLAIVYDSNENRKGVKLLTGIVPLSGWNKPYKYLRVSQFQTDVIKLDSKDLSLEFQKVFIDRKWDDSLIIVSVAGEDGVSQEDMADVAEAFLAAEVLDNINASIIFSQHGIDVKMFPKEIKAKVLKSME
jgi:hypothetical protein